MAATVDRSGGIDIVDNNAALTDPDVLARDSDVTEMDVEVWEQMMTVNLRSQLLMTEHAVPDMICGGGGAIVNMSSGVALKGDVILTQFDAARIRGWRRRS